MSSFTSLMLDSNIAMLKFFISKPFNKSVQITLFSTQNIRLLLVIFAHYFLHGDGIGHSGFRTSCGGYNAKRKPSHAP